MYTYCLHFFSGYPVSSYKKKKHWQRIVSFFICMHADTIDH